MTILFSDTGSPSAQAVFARRVAGRSNVAVTQTGFTRGEQDAARRRRRSNHGTPTPRRRFPPPVPTGGAECSDATGERVPHNGSVLRAVSASSMRAAATGCCAAARDGLARLRFPACGAFPEPGRSARSGRRGGARGGRRYRGRPFPSAWAGRESHGAGGSKARAPDNAVQGLSGRERDETPRGARQDGAALSDSDGSLPPWLAPGRS
jgi:hypothetical protein